MLKSGLIILLFSSVTHAQSIDFQFYGKSIPEIQQYFHSPVSAFRAAEFLPNISTITQHSPVPEAADSPVLFNTELASWKIEDLPFFCRIEHQLGKKLPVMFKFRLGSVEYVDWLEGKQK